MHLSALLMRQAVTILPFVLFTSIAALPSDFEPRADIDQCLNEVTTLDGPTNDQSAGIGVEFENTAVVFSSPKCNSTDTNQAKAKQVGDRKGENWQLTADTTLGAPGRLSAEYILNGKLIKIGTGAAAAAAAAVFKNIIAWNPYVDMPNNEWNIDGNNCNPWAIWNPRTGNRAGDLAWAVQVTAPFPFEAINDLFAAALTPPYTSPLLPAFRPSAGVISVTQNFFQSSPNGISQNDVKARADILGFFSLVISYVKKATPTSPPDYRDQSPKFSTFIMPRTEFVTLYAQLKDSKVPGTDTLYNLVKHLACYKNDGDNVELDSQFCRGTIEKPEPNAYIDGIGWCLKNVDTNAQGCLKVGDWIDSIDKGPSPDKLTILDRLIDGQIGGFDTRLEIIKDTTRAVPLFEIRNLASVTGEKMENVVSNAEKAILTYFDKYKSPPKRRKAKRNSNRSSLTGGYRQAKVAATRHWSGQCRPLGNREIARGKGDK